MPLLQLTLLYSLLSFFAGDHVSEYSPSAETNFVEPAKEAEAANIVLQSKDGGQTWQDISRGLPDMEQPEGFFAGASEIYVRSNGVLYRSKSNLNTPVWEKENVPHTRSTSIAFNPSGVIAYSNEGEIYQKQPSDPDSNRDWLPVYTSLKSTSLQQHSVETIFETSDGTLLLSTGKSISRSADKARSWKLVQKGGVSNIVESEGVLFATGQKGIMRSTDRGEHWDWIISEGGGQGIDVERIDGGLAAIVYNTHTQFREIFISTDNGKTWKAIDKGLPPSSLISSIKQMGSDLFVGHPDGIFRSRDMGKTWQRVHPGFGNSLHAMLNFAPWLPEPAKDPDGKVFYLQVSGTTLYAIAATPGC